MKLKVLRYSVSGNYHECICLETQNNLFLDLFVSGNVAGETNDSIVGKTISISHSVPYLEIAYGVQVLAEKVEGEK